MECFLELSLVQASALYIHDMDRADAETESAYSDSSDAIGHTYHASDSDRISHAVARTGSSGYGHVRGPTYTHSISTTYNHSISCLPNPCGCLPVLSFSWYRFESYFFFDSTVPPIGNLTTLLAVPGHLRATPTENRINA